MAYPLGEVYAVIDTDQFSICFSRWVSDLANITEGEIIAIDGKGLRRSIDKASKKAAIYMVSAWAQQNNLVLGQVKVDDKSNEITAIPKLLSRLDIAGALITIDAMGCQKKIAMQIKKQGGDYVFSLKGNQGNLHDDVKTFFTSSLSPTIASVSYDGEQGRIETRSIRASRTIFTGYLMWLLMTIVIELAKDIVLRILLLSGILPWIWSRPKKQPRSASRLSD